MRKLLSFACFLSLLPSLSNAQVDELNYDSGIGSFQEDKDSWRRKEEDDKPKVIQTFYDSFGNLGIKNITDAEQVYCYSVDAAQPQYEGYTINNMLVKSFCGSVSGQLKDAIVFSLFGDEKMISPKQEQCIIRPTIMFRFVRGVDYTDVLLSSPCYSITVYYAGKMRTYNFKAGAEVIDEMVSVFSVKENNMPFISPALLGQLMPIGFAQTEEQKKIVKESKASSETGPKRNWEDEEKKKPVEPKKGGWNNLDI